MLITRETDYALRTLRTLSCGRKITQKEICEQEAIPAQFAYKLFKKLSNAGILQITRGADGGYELKADLRQLTLYDLLTAMWENWRINACMDEGYACSWRAENKGECSIHCHLRQLQEELDQQLKRYTVAQLLEAPAKNVQ